MSVSTYKNSYSLSLLITMALLLLGASSCTTDGTSNSAPADDGGGTPLKIVSLSGVITEVLFDLGQDDNIVGVDVTSTYPAEGVADKAQLGHTSKLNTEAILALQPDIIFCMESEVEKPALQQLASSGVKVVPVTVSSHLNNSVVLAEQLTQHLNLDSELQQQLSAQVESDSVALASFLASQTEQPRVLFIYARGTSRLFVSGTDTPVDAMIKLAGGQTAITGFSDYKELTSESLIAANPEVILMFSSGLASLDGVEGLKQIPGIDQTEAYKSERVIAMDGHYLSSFGPRCGAAALQLAQSLHPKPE